MVITFYISAAIAVITTLLAISRLEPVHGLLNLIVSLLAVAVIFYTLGAPFAAALEVITYAGAIMVVFVFVVMLLNASSEALAKEKEWLQPRAWIVPGFFAAILLAQMVYLLTRGPGVKGDNIQVLPVDVGVALFGPYVLAVELASMLLLAGLVGAHHLGRREAQVKPTVQAARQAEEKR